MYEISFPQLHCINDENVQLLSTQGMFWQGSLKVQNKHSSSNINVNLNVFHAILKTLAKHMMYQRYLTAIRTYFTRWLIRMTSLVWFSMICLNPSDG